MTRSLASFVVLAACSLVGMPVAAGNEQLTLKVVDKDTGRPVAARMHLKDGKGKPVQPPGVPFWKDHFAFDGSITLKLPRGGYTFELERGPEYLTQTGHFRIEAFANDEKTVEVKRFIHMAEKGWWSGELHIHRPPADMPLLMKAEDLHVGPVITWWNKTNRWAKKPLPEPLLMQTDGDRFYHLLAGEDERRGGAVLFFHLKRPLEIASAQPEYPCVAKFVEQAAAEPGVHIDLEKPYWWDAPLLLATGKIHTIGLANNHLWRDGVLDNEAWGKPRDKTAFPGPHGNGRWSQAIYYHVLNAGLKIPPSAGSASGVHANPVGYNRVYVFTGKEFSYARWWDGLRAGQVVVTNGPLMIPTVQGQPPGHTFQVPAGEKGEYEVALTLSTKEKIEYLEVVQDGRVAHDVRLDDWAKAGGRLPKVTFERSGWFLVRAITNAKGTYRFATTGPYYVQVGDQPRISRESAQFFLDWARERTARMKIDDATQREEVLSYHRAAEKFWQERVKGANAE